MSGVPALAAPPVDPLPETRLRASAVLTWPRLRPSAAEVADSVWENSHVYDGLASGSIYFLSRDPAVSLTRSPYGYVDGNPLNDSDPSGQCGLWGNDTCWGHVGGFVKQAWNATGGKAVNWVQHNTIGLCVNAGAGAGPYGDATGCVALVGGHFTAFGTLAGGGSSPTASLTGGLLISNASQPNQLSKGFGFGGASGDFGVSAGDEFSVGQDSCGGTIWENQVTAGVGLDLPIPGEYHGGASYTWVWSP